MALRSKVLLSNWFAQNNLDETARYLKMFITVLSWRTEKYLEKKNGGMVRIEFSPLGTIDVNGLYWQS